MPHASPFLNLQSRTQIIRANNPLEQPRPQLATSREESRFIRSILESRCERFASPGGDGLVAGFRCVAHPGLRIETRGTPCHGEFAS